MLTLVHTLHNSLFCLTYTSLPTYAALEAAPSADQYVPTSTFDIPCDNVLLSRRHALLSLRTVKVSITTPSSTVAAGATGGLDSTTRE
ncbi:hypothetical protein B0H14DRAFT_3504570 [Mycena olivaceomarginata]|nr:hypothetical protein B0H14DRAFT_3504570 [Mycena olivaceomarginata]